MNVTNELDELIALHGNARDALNVTLAKLRQAEGEIAVLKDAAQQGVQPTLLQCDFTDCQEPVHSMLCKEHYYESQSG